MRLEEDIGQGLSSAQREVLYRFHGAAAILYGLGMLLTLIVAKSTSRKKKGLRVKRCLQTLYISVILLGLSGAVYSAMKCLQARKQDYDMSQSTLFRDSAPCLVMLGVAIAFRPGLLWSVALLQLTLAVIVGPSRGFAKVFKARHVSHVKFASFGLDLAFTGCLLYDLAHLVKDWEGKPIFHLQTFCTYEFMVFENRIYPFYQTLALFFGLFFVVLTCLFMLKRNANHGKAAPPGSVENGPKFEELSSDYEVLPEERKKTFKSVSGSAMGVLTGILLALPALAWRQETQIQFWLATETLCYAIASVLIPALAFALHERLETFELTHAPFQTEDGRSELTRS